MSFKKSRPRYFGILVLPLFALLFYSSSEGPLSPIRAEESPYGGVDWDHRNNLKVSDGNYATVNLGDVDSSDFLLATKFSFAIPVGATIDGIEVTVERKGESGAIKDAMVSLIKGGVICETNYASGYAWSEADEIFTYGGSADLWGLTLTEADVNADDFGVAIATKRAVTGGGDKTASVDHIEMKVHYTVVLPVELLSFTAESEGKEVELKWTTASEKNNDYFLVERSENGISFTEIAKVDGSGNLSSKRNYTTHDSEPLEGISYYRLKQVDFNGEAYTYNSIAISRLSSRASPCTFRVFPNPCPGNCNISLEDCPGGQDKEITLAVFDALGNKVMSNVLLRDSKGSLNFSIDTKNVLMPGVYIVQASDEKEKYQQKVVMKNQ